MDRKRRYNLLAQTVTDEASPGVSEHSVDSRHRISGPTEEIHRNKASPAECVHCW